MAALATRMEELSFKYGKPDMERLGIFIEMPYMEGKGYVSPFPKPIPDKGRGILGEGRKSKNGTQHGYFDDEFRRLFIGEAIKRPPKRKQKKPEGEAPKKKGKRQLGMPFIPAGSTKLHSCPGDHYGTFGGIIEAFGRETIDKPPLEKQKRNFTTSPGKKGGPGYPKICLSKYPEHLPDPYRQRIRYKEYGRDIAGPIITVHYPQPFFDKNPFKEEKFGLVYVPPKEEPVPIIGEGRWIPNNPAKWQGGCHDGMFSPFPKHMTDRDAKKEKKMKEERKKMRAALDEEGKIVPQSLALKTMFTTSVLKHNTNMCVNVSNYKVYEPVYTKHLLAKE